MTQEETKAKAWELITKFTSHSSTWDEYADIQCAIISTQNTIETLEQVNEKSKVKMGELFIYHEDICDAIDEQEQILNELKSRLWN